MGRSPLHLAPKSRQDREPQPRPTALLFGPGGFRRPVEKRFRPMPSNDRNGLDGWLIGELRRHARPPRVDDLILEETAVSKLVCRVDTAERELAELRSRLQRAERRLDGTSVHHAVAHTRFVPSVEGYDIVESEGPPPRAGDSVTLGDGRFRVLRVGRSPFPFDRRPCVYLVPE